MKKLFFKKIGQKWFKYREQHKIGSLLHRLTRFRTPEVRDLAWVILSPPLLYIPNGRIYWPPSSWFLKNYLSCQEWLRHLDRSPEPLLERLGELTDRRLGKYFEALMRFWLENNQRYKLIAHNVQVGEKEKTLGELDFIVQDQHLDKFFHWEVAVKFYLGYGETKQLRNWHGPNRKDRFDKKMDRLITHQTALGETAAGRIFLKEQNITLSRSWVILKGQLFYPFQNGNKGESAPPLHVAPEVPTKGWWMTESQFHYCFQESPLVWFELNKRNWLSGIMDTERKKGESAYKLLKRWKSQHRKIPIRIAGFLYGEEKEQGFLVPENWANTPPDFDIDQI